MHSEHDITCYSERMRPQMRQANALAAHWQVIDGPAQASGPVLGVVRYEVPTKGGECVHERRVCLVEPGFLGRGPWEIIGNEPFALEPGRTMVVTHWMPLPVLPDDPEIDDHNARIGERIPGSDRLYHAEPVEGP